MMGKGCRASLNNNITFAQCAHGVFDVSLGIKELICFPNPLPSCDAMSLNRLSSCTFSSAETHLQQSKIFKEEILTTFEVSHREKPKIK